MGGTSLSFFVLVLGLLLFAGLILSIIAFFRADRIVEPGCGRCRYPVRGLATLICPECGADFREFGIIAKGMRPARRGRGLFVMGCWVVACVVGALLSALVLGETPLLQRFQVAQFWTISGSSGAFAAIDASVISFGRTANEPAASIELDVTTPGARRLMVDLRAPDWSYRHATGGTKSGNTLPTSADIRTWLSACSADITRPGVDAEIDALARFIAAGGSAQSLAAGPLIINTSGSSRYVRASPTGLAMVALAWLALAIAGCAVIRKKESARSRRGAMPAPAQTGAPLSPA